MAAAAIIADVVGVVVVAMMMVMMIVVSADDGEQGDQEKLVRAEGLATDFRTGCGFRRPRRLRRSVSAGAIIPH